MDFIFFVNKFQFDFQLNTIAASSLESENTASAVLYFGCSNKVGTAIIKPLPKTQ
jgi:hypothetical protein